jgi:hypothetical protein
MLTSVQQSTVSQMSGTRELQGDFPQTAPIGVPRFTSPAKRDQRNLRTRFLRSEGTRIEAVPLRVASPPVTSTSTTGIPVTSSAAPGEAPPIPQPVLSFDASNPQSWEAVKRIITEVLKELGVTTTTSCISPKKSVRKKSGRSDAIRAQQARMSKEEDDWWKVIKCAFTTLRCSPIL